MSAITKNLMALSERQFEGAIREIERQHRVELRKLSTEIIRAVIVLEREIVLYVVRQTGVPAGQVKRRLKVFKPPSGAAAKLLQAYAGLSVQKNANIFHTGRIKGTKRRGNSIVSIPGVHLAGKAFLMRPWVKGEKRRIYQRIGDDIISVNHPLTLTEVFKRFDKRAQQLTDRAIRRAYR